MGNQQAKLKREMDPPTASATVNGESVKKDSVFRNFVTADGSSGFAAEKGRYHLYVSLACPWVNRILIVRALKGLEEVFPYTGVDWMLSGTPKGWSFTNEKSKCTLDIVNKCNTIREVYQIADPDFTGDASVPLLWDKKKKTIVNNDSGDIIRMLNTEFNEFCPTVNQKNLHLYPSSLKESIDELNSWIHPTINYGVYDCGRAQTQEAYDTAVTLLFESLDKVENILSKNCYLTGNTLTEADIRLFTTLVRFDMAYVGHFKCDKKRVMDYPNMSGYVCEIYQMPGVAETVDVEHIRKHYYICSNESINPDGIVSVGPDIDFSLPHGRDSSNI